MTIDKGRALRQRADFGQKLSRPLFQNRRNMAEAVALRHRDPTLEHDEHAAARLAGREHAFAVGVALHIAEAAQALDLLGLQIRKRLIDA